MRYYVEINGVSSLNINGLAIKELPPITKPLMRNMKEEIDGRDGDLITELGYSAYDKQIEIGLYGNFDIDAIIKYFTGEGTITFSNEPDKFYYFKILDQIDYEKLLKFKTATITFHCQPFKYPKSETPIENTLTTLTGSGTDITINDTEPASMQFTYNGNTYQDSTTGKNLLDLSSEPITSNRATKTFVEPKIEITKTDPNANAFCLFSIGNASDYNGVNLKLTGNCLATGTTRGRVNFGYADADGSNRVNVIEKSGLTNESFSINMTVDGDTYSTKKVVVWLYSDTSQAGSIGDKTTYENVMVSTSGGDYEPYTNGPSPNPDYPQEVHVVSGDNEVEVVGKNFFNDNAIINASTYATDTHISNGKRITTTLTGNGYYQCRYIVLDIKKYIGKTFRLKANYVASGNNVPAYTIGICDSEGNNRTSKGTATTSGTVLTYTATQDTITDTKHYLYVILYVNAGGNATSGEYADFTNITLTVDNEDMTYTPYAGTTYPINLPEGMFLGSIGDYQDRFFKAIEGDSVYDSLDSATKETLDTNEWYLEKKIGKVVLNGTEGWTQATSGDFQYTHNISNIVAFNDGGSSTKPSTNALCDHFIPVLRYYIVSGNHADLRISYNDTYGVISYDAMTTLSNFTTWLGSNNTSVYYQLATPTYTKITDDTLLEQLEATKLSYISQTNITQTNDDLPFNLDVSMTFLYPLTVNNVGNIYAKPVLEIEGSGNIGVILNRIQILEIALGDVGKIAIDVPNLEAFNPDDNSLLNRLVTGDYMKFLINEGNNTIAFDGNVTKATLSKYTRWI